MTTKTKTAPAKAEPISGWHWWWPWVITPGLAVLSLVGSAFSVYMSHRTLDLNEQTLQHNRMLVVPIMGQRVFERSGPNIPNSVGFAFKNNGLGPAVIHETAVTFDGKRLDHRNSDEWRRAIREALGEGVTSQITYLDAGNAIRPGDEHVLLSLSESAENRLSVSALRTGLSKFEIQITYSSVYGGDRKSVRGAADRKEKERINVPTR